MKLPRMWRKKRGQRFVGSYHCSIKGQDVNLGTSDAKEARERLLEAVTKGKRNFVADLDVAADALEADGASEAPAPALSMPEVKARLEAGQPVAVEFRDPPPEQRALPALPAAAPPAQPDDADGMAAAAADVGGRPENDNAGAGPTPGVEPEVLDELLASATILLVDAQLRLQAAAVKRYTGKTPAPVPLDSPLAQGAAKAWAAQLKIWIPSDLALPPWALALVLPAMCLPAQVASAMSSQAPAGDGSPTEKAAA